MSVRMLQNVMTVRYQRHTCSRESQTPVVAASVIIGPFFTYLPPFHEGIFGSIMYETMRCSCEYFSMTEIGPSPHAYAMQNFAKW